jgi:hypothetical protein
LEYGAVIWKSLFLSLFLAEPLIPQQETSSFSLDDDSWTLWASNTVIIRMLDPK